MGKVKVHIGGHEGDGNSTEWNNTGNWNNPGWEMKFEYDHDSGAAHGHNTNDGPAQRAEKTYTGTVHGHNIDLTSNFGVRYTGEIHDGKMCTFNLHHATSGHALGRGIVKIKKDD
ncbi:hypothetical protein Pelo_8110 [Pelomyxa schiedti]|nr:hypothetical protein Pelo_8110 [Pelomyxa schiedti]